MDISRKLARNNFIGASKVRSILRAEGFEVEIKDIKMNGQKRGCNGFVHYPESDKYVYINTEPFFDNGKGSGLMRDENKAIMCRTAKNNKDYTGGFNQFCSMDAFVNTVKRIAGE